MELVIGMTACPRQDIPLTRAVVNLRYGGFHEDLHIFAEPGLGHPELPNIVWHNHPKRLGGVRNWLHAANWLLEHTASPYIMIVEDDVDYCCGARARVESRVAAGEFGVLSLYLARRYAKHVGTKQGWIAHNYGTRTFGMLSLVFSRPLLREFVDSATVKAALASGKQNISYDSLLFGWFRNTQRAHLCFAHRPSLADHVGPRSNLRHADGAHRRGLEFKRDYE